jgi:predicted ester cyclase
MTSREAQNKAVVRRFFEAFEANDLAALSEVLAPGLVAYTHGQPDPENREQHLETIRGWNAAFGETRFTIEEQIAEGDTVATRMLFRSVHSRGHYMGLPPTGKQVVMAGISFERIQDGKIVERRVQSDWVGLLQQLGLAAGPQAAG